MTADKHLSPAPATTFEEILDFNQIAAELTRIGFRSNKGGAITPTTVRRWADAKKIPVFLQPSGRRAITRDTLAKRVLQMQAEAVRSCAAAQDPKKRRA